MAVETYAVEPRPRRSRYEAGNRLRRYSAPATATDVGHRRWKTSRLPDGSAFLCRGRNRSAVGKTKERDTVGGSLQTLASVDEFQLVPNRAVRGPSGTSHGHSQSPIP